jgi:cobalt-zinc-cadmium efflux system outer membrane protein
MAARKEIDALTVSLGLTKVEGAFREGDIGVAGEKEPDGTWLVGPAIGIELPIFDFGQARVPRAEAIMRQAYQRFTAIAVRIRNAVHIAAGRTLSTQRQALHYRDTLIPLSQQILQQTQRQYNAMQIGVFQLLHVKQQQINTGIEYIAALRSYWMARSELDQMINGVLPEGNNRQFGRNVVTLFPEMRINGGH